MSLNFCLFVPCDPECAVGNGSHIVRSEPCWAPGEAAGAFGIPAGLFAQTRYAPVLPRGWVCLSPIKDWLLPFIFPSSQRSRELGLPTALQEKGEFAPRNGQEGLQLSFPHPFLHNGSEAELCQLHVCGRAWICCYSSCSAFSCGKWWTSQLNTDKLLVPATYRSLSPLTLCQGFVQFLVGIGRIQADWNHGDKINSFPSLIFDFSLGITLIPNLLYCFLVYNILYFCLENWAYFTCVHQLLWTSSLSKYWMLLM